jgi:hypothetical protein
MLFVLNLVEDGTLCMPFSRLRTTEEPSVMNGIWLTHGCHFKLWHPSSRVCNEHISWVDCYVTWCILYLQAVESTLIGLQWTPCTCVLMRFAQIHYQWTGSQEYLLFECRLTKCSSCLCCKYLSIHCRQLCISETCYACHKQSCIINHCIVWQFVFKLCDIVSLQSGWTVSCSVNISFSNYAWSLVCGNVMSFANFGWQQPLAVVCM